jgi:anti-sigma B factor antagonist
MSSLQIIVDSDKDLAVMTLRGRISIETSPDLRIRLLAILRTLNPPAVIDIDLTGVSYLDTSGMATLIEGLKIARVGGIAMRLQGLQGRLLHLFQATGIGSLFDTGSPANKFPTTTVS